MPVNPPSYDDRRDHDRRDHDDRRERASARRARRAPAGPGPVSTRGPASGHGSGPVPGPGPGPAEGGARSLVGPEIDPPDPGEVPETGPAPVRRLLSLVIAGFAGLLGIGLIFGAQTAGVGAARAPYGIVIFGVQALFVISWAVAVRPPAPRVVATVGLITAAAADIVAITPDRASLAPLGYVAAGGLVAGVVGQLARRSSRLRATESLSATLVIVVGVVAFSTLIVLTRIPVGTQAIVVCLTSTTVSLVVARVLDALIPFPRLAPQVARGASGVVVGAMAGSVTGAVLGSLIHEFNPGRGAFVGFVAAFSAVLADLSISYAEAGRQLAGEPGSFWLVRHMQGPLGGFALAAPAAYVISVVLLVPKLAVA